MAVYKIEVKRSALNDLEKLDKRILRQMISKMEALTKNPRPVQSLKLSGSEYCYRLRVGKYRLLYQINETAKIVIIFAVGHRKDIYRGL